MQRTRNHQSSLLLKPPTVFLLLAAIGWINERLPGATEQLLLFIRTSDLFKLADSPGPGHSPDGMYEMVQQIAFPQPLFDRQSLIAFEENQRFVYAVAVAPKLAGAFRTSRAETDQPRLIRRFIFLRPATFVIEDEVETAISAKSLPWRLYLSNPSRIASGKISTTDGSRELTCQTLLPKQAIYRRKSSSASSPETEDVIEITPQGDSGEGRFVHVFQVGQPGRSPVGQPQLVEKGKELHLTLPIDQQIFRFVLPEVKSGAGEISISSVDGRTLVPPRSLAAGILPHGPEGMKLLEQWDVDYRRKNPPLWDAGVPSNDLKKAVDDRTIPPGRAVELGCGSGTDAVFLASKGFDVTAIDIAPTALGQALEKARKAGVQVRWLLADVLNPPRLDSFDFIYDRGCYHEVRGGNLAAYVETVRRYSHPGTRFLLLAGNINETVVDYGPPRVAEEEIRDDFSAWFDFEWIRESRFEVASQKALGPLAWSVLMRRKADGRQAK
jgi:SAM-dependent methyltransferase